MELLRTGLLLCLCGVAVSERLLPPQHFRLRPPAHLSFPDPGPRRPVPGAPLTDPRAIEPVRNVFVSGEATLETYNSSVVETCTADGTSLTFRWFNDSTEITGDGYRIHVAQTENSGTLTISPFYRFDLATWTYCQVSNPVSTMNSRRFTFVGSIPDGMTIFPEAPPSYVASGSGFSLTCSTSDEPVANITWYLDGVELETRGSRLSVMDIEREGLGSSRSLYTCNATGLTTGKYRPSMPVVFTIIKKISGVWLNSSVTENTSANLSCSVTSGSMQTFRWLKDGAVLNPDGRVVISADRTTVHIQPLQETDNGEYTCEVSNPVSAGSALTILAVYFEPEGLSGGAIAGIVIGVLLGVGLGVGFFVFWLKKRH